MSEKIIQISTVPASPQWSEAVYALTDKGNLWIGVWKLHGERIQWDKIPLPPELEEGAQNDSTFVVPDSQLDLDLGDPS